MAGPSYHKLPTVDSMGISGATSSRLLVYEYAGAGSCKRRAIAVEGTVQLCLCEQFAFDVRTLEEIQGEQSLLEESIP